MSLLESWRPTAVVGNLEDVDPGWLKSQLPPDVKVLFYDLDRTIAGQHDAGLSDKMLEHFKAMDQLGYMLGIGSNAGEQGAERVHNFADSIAYHIGKPVLYQTSHEAKRKKPDAEFFKLLAELAGVKPSEMAYIGDQMRKDTHGAWKAGYGATILTAPYGKRIRNLSVTCAIRPFEIARRLLIRDVPVLARNFGKVATASAVRLGMAPSEG